MSLPYRPNACMIVINDKNEILLCERAGERNNIWQFPQGGIEPGHNIQETALRELEEELGASEHHFEVLKILSAKNRYDFADPPPYALNKWRGQEQTFVLCRFKGSDSDMNLATSCGEFKNFQWVTINLVQNLVEPRRAPGYLKALEEVVKILL